LVHQHVSAPAVLDGLLDVPKPIGGVFDFLQQCDVVIPGNLCKHLLHNVLIGPGFGKRPHVFEIARRNALHFWKLTSKVLRQAVDHSGTPAFLYLPLKNISANMPVE